MKTIAAIAVAFAFTLSAVAESQAWLSQPAISPDGTEIAFSSGGDIWSVPRAGGDARLLVAHAADDRRPVWSPDGARLAFMSDRTGNGDIYVLTLANGGLDRLTFDDATEQLDAWSSDGWIYFTTSTAEVSGMSDVYRVRASGGTPMPFVAERYTAEYFPSPSPDGSAVLVNARGFGLAQWWRRGHSHIDESEIWLAQNDGHDLKRVVDRGAKSLWPMWAADGRSFFFTSDRSGAENLWSSDLEGRAKQLTGFTDGRLIWPSISRDGRAIVFERDFRLWTVDAAAGAATPIAVSLRGAPAARGAEFRKLTSGIDELAISPDGKKAAFTVRGEVFAVSAADGGEATRVTRSAEPEMHVSWSPDSRKIAYVSTRAGNAGIVVYDFVSRSETRLTTSELDIRPRFSPDGRSIAFLRGGSELRVVDPATKAERLVASGKIDFLPPISAPGVYAWSPDSAWLAWMSTGDRYFRNAYVARVSGGAPLQASFVANTGGDSIAWGADGKSLYFASGQRTEPGQVARVDLVPRTPKFREEQFRDLFKDGEKKDADAASGAKNDEKKGDADAKAAKKDAPAVEVIMEGIRTRLALLPLAVDVDSIALSPDGKNLAMIASAEGAPNIYAWSLDELAKDPPVVKQLTSTAGEKSLVQFSGDSKSVWYLEDGSIASVSLESKQPKSLSVSAGMEIDFDTEKQIVFEQAWRWQNLHFHDAKMNGVDWDATRARFAPIVTGTRTQTELQRLLSMMVGELNASHLGVRSGDTPPRTTARLGMRFDRARYQKEGVLAVSGVVPMSPATVTRKITAGDILVAVDGVALSKETALERLLDNRVGREVKLSFAPRAGEKARRDVVVKPLNQGGEKDLLYREWVEKNRALVAALSGGRLGYVHMLDMGYESLLQLMADLDAENMTREGIVFDIRNNNGGFVNAYALDILSRRHYLNMALRGYAPGPARTLLGQRSLERPTVLVTNQHSLSDAEDFSEGYRAMGLGKIVGEPTAGWIIYTSNYRAIDGTVVRIPFVTLTTAKGEPMEMAPRPVDVEVRRALGEDAAARDSQLEAAVKALLTQIGK
ncbi:MAG: LpqB family beta-propeller domain-containing protein [Thermoanaerobaculia bacterium]|jgi:Tol biopolymer transport system component